MTSVTATIGLPASGKSTWARNQQKNDFSIVLVSKDEIRAMLYGKGVVPWSSENERLTEAVRDGIVRASLIRGKSVIVHDTNLGSLHVKRLEQIARRYGASFEIKDFTDVSVEECIKRDAGRNASGLSVGSKVIMKMYNQYLKAPDAK